MIRSEVIDEYIQSHLVTITHLNSMTCVLLVYNALFRVTVCIKITDRPTILVSVLCFISYKVDFFLSWQQRSKLDLMIWHTNRKMLTSEINQHELGPESLWNNAYYNPFLVSISIKQKLFYDLETTWRSNMTTTSVRYFANYPIISYSVFFSEELFWWCWWCW